jgi:hypothetical protein
MSDVGGILYDQDATFVEIGSKPAPPVGSDGLDELDPRAQLLESLKNSDLPSSNMAANLDDEDDTLQLFRGSKPLSMEQLKGPQEQLVQDGSRQRRRAVFSNADAEDDDDEEGDDDEEDGDDDDEGHGEGDYEEGGDLDLDDDEDEEDDEDDDEEDEEEEETEGDRGRKGGKPTSRKRSVSLSKTDDEDGEEEGGF